MTKKYIKSEIEFDISAEFYDNKSYVVKTKTNRKRQTKTTNKIELKRNGYCIRTGVEIPFNIRIPYCDSAYKSWKIYENDEYAEKFCHFSGEKSNGKTSMKKPILNKNWKEAKKIFDL